jgi:hypothetical protein
MLEASDYVTDFWFSALEIPLLLVPKDIDNTGSRRTSQKQDMRMVAVNDRNSSAAACPRRSGRSPANGGSPGKQSSHSRFSRIN